MVHLKCLCANIVLHLADNPRAISDVADCAWPWIATEPALKEVVSYAVGFWGVGGMNVEQSSLAGEFVVHDMTFTHCYNCGTTVFGQKTGEDQLLLNMHVVAAETTSHKEHPCFSPIFRVICFDLNHPFPDRSTIPGDNRKSFDELSQQVDEAMVKEKALMQERIKAFTDEQQRQFEVKQEEALAQQSCLYQRIVHKQKHPQGGDGVNVIPESPVRHKASGSTPLSPASSRDSDSPTGAVLASIKDSVEVPTSRPNAALARFEKVEIVIPPSPSGSDIASHTPMRRLLSKGKRKQAPQPPGHGFDSPNGGFSSHSTASSGHDSNVDEEVPPSASLLGVSVEGNDVAQGSASKKKFGHKRSVSFELDAAGNPVGRILASSDMPISTDDSEPHEWLNSVDDVVHQPIDGNTGGLVRATSSEAVFKMDEEETGGDVGEPTTIEEDPNVDPEDDPAHAPVTQSEADRALEAGRSIDIEGGATVESGGMSMPARTVSSGASVGLAKSVPIAIPQQLSRMIASNSGSSDGDVVEKATRPLMPPHLMTQSDAAADVVAQSFVVPATRVQGPLLGVRVVEEEEGDVL